MGEQMADTLKDEIEIKIPTAAETVLNASVSFGRFENDLLCWERWSSFSQNKYLEEVEKCSTPGSVAKKKAYFEAHYKKIAARKAELLAQEQEMRPDSLRSDNSSDGNPIDSGCGTNLEFKVSDCDNMSKSVEAYENSTVVVHSNHVDESKQDAGVPDCQGLLNEGVREIESSPDGPELNNSEVDVSVKEENDSTGLQPQLEELAVFVKEEVVMVKQENHLIGSLDKLETTYLLDDQTANSQVNKTEDAALKPWKGSEKTTSAVKEKNLARTRKETTARIPKPKATKPAVAPPATVASRVSTIKQSKSLLPKNRNSLVVESKISTPKSLHMSLSLAPKNADTTSPNLTRKSLIMEKMGDKEIVKRAFGQFQKNLNISRPSTEAKPTVPHKVSTNGTKQIGTATITPRKDTDGRKKALEKESSQRGQVGAKLSSASARPVKAACEHQRSARASPSSAFVLKSDERAERRKEFTKKLEEKSNAKEAESMHLRSKSKEEKAADIKKLRQSLNFKATPMPDFYRGQQISKTNKDKEAANNEIRCHK